MPRRSLDDDSLRRCREFMMRGLRGLGMDVEDIGGVFHCTGRTVRSRCADGPLTVMESISKVAAEIVSAEEASNA